MRVRHLLLPSLLSIAVFVAGESHVRAQELTPALHHALHASAMDADASRGYKYVGPGSCSAAACHGGIQPRDVTKVLQNEYSTWIVEDRHSRAFTVLNQPLAKRMASILKIGPADKAQKCLVCHALSVTPAEHAREFDIAEGVSCESCHGPSSQWLGPHVQASAKHAEMVRLGLIDNKNLAIRAEKCLTCHLGAPGLEVDHEMLAAGHPVLSFELDSFDSIEPPHWVEKGPDQKQPIADPLLGVRIWSVGQVVQLRQSMLRLARHAKGPIWPEYTEMDCYTCHHALTKPEDSWRQQIGYADRRPGNPPYDSSRNVVFRHVAREVDAATTKELEDSVNQVAALVAQLQPDRADMAAKAEHAAAVAERLTHEIESAHFDKAQTEHLMIAISADADAVSFQGERSAEQATMALDSLYRAYAKDGQPNQSVRVNIDAMYKLLDNPSSYSALKFSAQMKKVEVALK